MASAKPKNQEDASAAAAGAAGGLAHTATEAPPAATDSQGREFFVPQIRHDRLVMLPTLAEPQIIQIPRNERAERIEDNQRRAKLYARLAKVTAEVRRIPKNGWNEYHKYAYAYESDITDGLRAILHENGIAFLPPEVVTFEIVATKSDKVGDVARVTMRFTLADIETGETVESILIGEGQDKGDKAFYKAYTGAVKYFLCKTFLIATGDDPESTSPQNQPSGQQPPQQAPEKATAPAKPATARDLAIEELKAAIRALPKNLRPDLTADSVGEMGTTAIRQMTTEIKEVMAAREAERNQQQPAGE